MSIERLKKFLNQIGPKIQLHGVPKIFTSKKISIKLAWSLICLLSAYFLVRNLLLAVNEYLAFKVVTNINIVRNTTLDLPAIKICSLNPSTKNYSVRDVVISCKFAEKINCLNETYLTYDHDQFEERKCVKFNYNSSLVIKRAGMFMGLVIKIFDGLI